MLEEQRLLKELHRFRFISMLDRRWTVGRDLGCGFNAIGAPGFLKGVTILRLVHRHEYSWFHVWQAVCICNLDQSIDFSTLLK